MSDPLRHEDSPPSSPARPGGRGTAFRRLAKVLGVVLIVLAAFAALAFLLPGANRLLGPKVAGQVGRVLGDASSAGRLPEGWRYGGSSARRDSLSLRFAGPEGREIRVVLARPDGACAGGVSADEFCVAGPGAPAGLLDAVRTELDGAAFDEPWVAEVAGSLAERMEMLGSGLAEGLDRAWFSARGALSSAAHGARVAATDVRSTLVGTLGDFGADLFHARYFAKAVWLMIFLLLGIRLVRGLRASPWQASLALAVLGLASLGVRALFQIDGPGDITFSQGSAFTGMHRLTYGIAPPSLVRLVARFVESDLEALYTTQLVIGSSAPVLLFLAVREVCGDTRTAFVSGWFLVISPLAVRFSGSANPSTYVLVLGILALWSLARYLERNDRTDLLLHCIALLLMAQSRPEAFVNLPIFSAAVFALGPGRWAGRRRRFPYEVLASQAVVAAVVLANAVLIGGDSSTASVIGVYLRQSGGFDLSLRNRSFLDPDLHSLVTIALRYAGLAWALVRPTPLSAWTVLAAEAAAAPAFIQSAAGVDLASARYQMLTSMPGAILAAEGLVRTTDLLAGWTRRPWVFPVIAVGVMSAVGVTSFDRLRFVNAPRTIDREFAFLVNRLGHLPPDAEIVYTYPPSDQPIRDFSLRPPTELSAALGYPGQRWVAWSGSLPPADRPRFFYRQAACAATLERLPGHPTWYFRTVRERCDELLRRSTPFVEEALPAFRWEADHYEGDRVNVGFYRLD